MTLVTRTCPACRQDRPDVTYWLKVHDFRCQACRDESRAQPWTDWTDLNEETTA